jgi:hypothetical protein
MRGWPSGRAAGHRAGGYVSSLDRKSRTAPHLLVMTTRTAAAPECLPPIGHKNGLEQDRDGEAPNASAEVSCIPAMDRRAFQSE